MGVLIRRFRQWLERMKRRMKVHRLLRQLELARAAQQSALVDLERVVRDLKKEKALPNPNGQRIAQLEGDLEAFERKAKRNQDRIDELERQLNDLDPDGSIRASPP